MLFKDEKMSLNKNRVFYHITLRKNLESIMCKGLIPDIGYKCKECCNDNPTEKLVYMTNLESVIAWKSSLYRKTDNCIVLEVNCEGFKLITRSKYIHGPEYACRTIIPPENIKLINLWFSYIYIHTTK